MARFNSTGNANRTVNKAGGESFIESPKLELASLVLTSFVKDQFYRNADESISRVKELVAADPLFAAKTAVYARNEFGMRSISHVVAGEVARNVKGQEWSKFFFDKVVRRVDDMTEILSYYYVNVGKNEPNALRKGFQKAFGRFSEYQLGKYKSEGKSVSLVDLVNVIHPTPTEKNKEALKKLIAGELKQTDTWENLGNSKETWEKLVSENKLGYFALLRNLRNILETAPELTDNVCELLTDKEAIKKSLVLPFRYSAALQALSEAQLPTTESRKVLLALSNACDISLSNVPEFSGDTLIAIDCSGSMQGDPINHASILGAALYRSTSADMMLFSNDARFANVLPNAPVLGIAKDIQSMANFGGTNFHAIFQNAEKPYKRVVILSDMQGWMGHNAPTSSFESYKLRTGANPSIFSFDLAGYGTLQFPEENIFCLAGFSEKVFDVMKLLEIGRDALVKKIEETDL